MENLDIIGAEIYAVISKVSTERYNKIPKKITEIFEKYKESAKNIKINPNIEFEKQEISKEAKDIMFVIALNYWLTDEEKEKALESLKLNEEKLKEKYNIEEIFKQRKNKQISKEEDSIDEKDEEISIVEKKENLLTKFINFVKKIFGKRK